MKTKANKAEQTGERIAFRGSTARQSVTGEVSHAAPGIEFQDARSVTAHQSTFQNSIDSSPRQAAQAKQLSAVFGAPEQREDEEDELQLVAAPTAGQYQAGEEKTPPPSRFDAIHREGTEEYGPLQGEFDSGHVATQSQTGIADGENRTGMPDQLKAGIERLSSMDLSDVRVQTDSPKPAQLNAHAYAQGNEIHLGPGQEKHLPHEAWHLVQQRQGRVRPTVQMAGGQVNDEEGLEREADLLGEKAVRAEAGSEKKGLTLRQDPASWTPRHDLTSRADISQSDAAGCVQRATDADAGAPPGGVDDYVPDTGIPSSEPEKLDYLRVCLRTGGGPTPGTVTAIWDSFGGDIDRVATANSSLFDLSTRFLNGCAQVGKTGAQFSKEIQAKALKDVATGRMVVEKERDFLKGDASDGKPVEAAARIRALENLQARTKELQALQDAQQSIRTLQVRDPARVPWRGNTDVGPNTPTVNFDPNNPLPDERDSETGPEPDEEVYEEPTTCEEESDLLTRWSAWAFPEEVYTPDPTTSSMMEDADAEDPSALDARIAASKLPWAGVIVKSDEPEETLETADLPPGLEDLPPGLEDDSAGGLPDFDSTVAYSWSELKAAWDVLLAATDEMRKSCPAAFALAKSDEGADFAKEKDKAKAMEQALAQFDELLNTKIPKAEADIPLIWGKLDMYHQQLKSSAYPPPFRSYAADQAIAAAQPADLSSLNTLLLLASMVPGPVGAAANLISLGVDAADAYASAKEAEALENARDVGLDVSAEEVTRANEDTLGKILPFPIPAEITGTLSMAFGKTLNTLKLKGPKLKSLKTPKTSPFTRKGYRELKRMPKWLKYLYARTYRKNWKDRAEAHIRAKAKAGDASAKTQRDILDKWNGQIHHPIPVQMSTHALIEAAALAGRRVLNDASLGIALPKLEVSAATLKKYGKKRLAGFPAHAAVPGHAIYNGMVEAILDRKLLDLCGKAGGSGGYLAALERLSKTKEGRKKIIVAADEAVAESQDLVRNWKKDFGREYLN